MLPNILVVSLIYCICFYHLHSCDFHKVVISSFVQFSLIKEQCLLFHLLSFTFQKGKERLEEQLQIHSSSFLL